MNNPVEVIRTTFAPIVAAMGAAEGYVAPQFSHTSVRKFAREAVEDTVEDVVSFGDTLEVALAAGHERMYQAALRAGLVPDYRYAWNEHV